MKKLLVKFATVLLLAVAPVAQAQLLQNGVLTSWGGFGSTPQVDVPAGQDFLTINVSDILGYDSVAQIYRAPFSASSLYASRSSSVSSSDYERVGNSSLTISNPAGARWYFSVSENDAFLSLTDYKIRATYGIYAPTITAQPVSQTVGEGSSVTFSVTATGRQVSYQWQRNGTDIGGATSSSYSISGVAPGHAGTYRCRVSNPTGALTSFDGNLTVRVRGSLGFRDAGQTVNEGNGVDTTNTVALVLQRTAPGGGVPDFGAVSVNFTLASQPGVNGQDYVAPSAGTVTWGDGDRGDKTIEVAIPQDYLHNGLASRALTFNLSSPAGGASLAVPASHTLTINEDDAPGLPRFVSAPQSRTILYGNNVTLSATAGGSAPMAYQWLENDSPLAGQTARQLALNNLTDLAPRNFRIVLSNAFGSVTSAVAAVRVEYLPNFAWARAAGGPQADRAWSTEVDASGNVYLAGMFTGTFRLGADTLTSAGDSDAFLAKYDRAGNVLWARQAGGTGGDRAYAVAVSATGQVYVCGFFSGSATFGGTTVTSAGSTDGFLAKYDSAGNVIWVRTGGGASADEHRAVAVDTAGNAYVTGEILGSANFGGVTLGEGGPDAHLLKYDGDGNLVWARQGTSGGEVSGYGVTTDSDGNVLITGFYSLGADFGSVSLFGFGARDVFVVKYDSAGNVLWGRRGGGGGSDYGFAVKTDAAGNVYEAGLTGGTASFDGVSVGGNGGDDAILVKYDSAGNVLWARAVGAAQNDRANALTVDAVGNAVVVGEFRDQLNLGVDNQISVGGIDAFAVRYGPDGTVVWSRRLGGAAADGALGVAAGGDGTIYLAGFFSGTAAAGAHTVTSASAEEDILLARLTVAPVITAPLLSRTVLAGGDVMFNAGMAGTALAYQWQRDGVDISGATTATVSLMNLSLAESGHDYRVIVTNAFGSVTSAVATVRVEYAPNFAWVRQAGSVEADRAQGVATDALGNVYVVGVFRGTVPMGTNVLVSAGDLDTFLTKYDRAGNVLWARQAGGTGEDRAYGVAVDAAGNVFVCGYFNGSADFGGTTVTSIGGTDAFLAKYDPTGAVLWVRRGGGTSADENRAVAVDAAGNAYVTGEILNSATFGGVTLTGSIVMAQVVKYDSAGNVVWARAGTSGGEVSGYGVATDGAGNVLITGFYSLGLDFGSVSINGFGARDLYVVKFDSAGAPLWGRGGGGSGSDYGFAVRADAAGNVYVAGLLEGAGSFGSLSASGNGGEDALLVKYDANGTPLWARTAGGSAKDAAHGVALDAVGNPVIGGEFQERLNLGAQDQVSAGGVDAFAIKYGPDGSVVWAQKLGGAATDNALGVALGGNGEVYLTGFFNGTSGAGGHAVFSASAAEDIFLARLTVAPAIQTVLSSRTVLAGGDVTFNAGVAGTALAYQWQRDGVNISGATAAAYSLTSLTLADSGHDYRVIVTNAFGSVTSAVAAVRVEYLPSFAWVRTAGGTGSDLGYSVATDASGNVLLAGHFSATATFGTNTFTSAGLFDLFVAKYDPAGNCLWARGMGSSDYDDAYGVTTDAAGNVYLTGYFSGTVVFGGTSLTSAGGRDLFLVKYSPTGALLWARGGGGGAFDYGQSVRVDATGNVYVLGRMEGNGTFGGVALTVNGNTDTVLVKYDANGTALWARRAGGSGFDWASDLVLDSAGNPLVTGNLGFQGATAVWDAFNYTSAGPNNFTVVKLNAADGAVLWLRGFGGGSTANALGISRDGEDNLYLAGQFNNTLTAGAFSAGSAGDYDAFLLKLDTLGNPLWLRTGGGPAGDIGGDVTVTPAGSILLTGEFRGTANFSGTNLVSAGGSDLFVIAYDPAGNVVWAHRAGGSGLDAGARILTDVAGNLLVAGTTTGPAGFGSLAVGGTGGEDAFVAKLVVAPAITAPLLSQTVLAGGGVTFNAGVAGSALAYQWQRDGVNLSGATTATYSLTNLTLANAGGYRVIVTNAFGSVTSAVAAVRVEYLPNFAWVRTAGGAGTDGSSATTTDAGGNVFMGGHFSGTAAIGTNTFTSAGFYDIFVAKYDAAGGVLWSRGFGSGDYDDVYDVAADSAGNVYVTGYYSGTVDFGGVSLTSAGGRDLFLAKFSPPGALLWVRSGGGGSHDYGQTVRVDGAGNVYVLGRMEASGSFGGVALTINGNTDTVLIKYDTNGNTLWARRGGGSGFDWAEDLVLDTAGNPIVTGNLGFQGATAAWDAFTYTTAGPNNFTVVKLNGADGAVMWLRGFGGSSTAGAHGISRDAADNVYVTGQFNNTMSAGAFSVGSGGGYDVFLLKLDAGGNPLWLRSGGSSGDDLGYDATVTPAGNVLITGEFAGSANFSSTNLISAGANDAFLIEYDPAGNVVWAHRMGGGGVDYGTRVVMDGAGAILVSGTSTGPASFGGLTTTGAGGEDAFVTKLTASTASFDAANEFSFTRNPNGVWSYGYSPTLGGTFVLYDTPGTRGTEWQFWYAVGVLVDPNIYFRPLAAGGGYFGVPLEPGRLAFHPGHNGEYSVLRWTAPVAGTYSIAANFTGLGGGSTDPHVLVNGVAVFDGGIVGLGSTNYQGARTLQAGDRVDFALGASTDGPSGDSTGLEVNIALFGAAGLSVTNAPSNPTAVAGSNVVFSVVASGLPPLAYQWFFNGTNALPSETNATLTLTNVGRASSGAYSAVINNGGGSLTNLPMSLRVLVPQRFTQPPVRLGDGRFRLVFGDHDGGLLSVSHLANLEVWATTNLVNTNAWVRVTDGISVVSGQVQVEDAGSPGLPRRFYRVIER